MIGDREVKVYDLVKSALLRNPETRNSDQKLIFEVWCIQGYSTDYHGHTCLNFMDIEAFMNSAHPKSIIENRRKLQRSQEENIRNGVYVPDSELLIADKEVLELREKRNQERGTHVFRDQVTIF